MTDADPADARHHQDVPGRQGAAGRQPRRAPRRDPRHLRRERRRQVDADEGAVRGLPARLLRAARSSSTASRAEFGDIRDSEQRGIVIIHQELALSPHLSIAENIFLGNERVHRGLIDWNRTNHEAADAAGAGSACARTRSPRCIGPRRRQAAAGRDRQGAVEGGQAADPRRADRGAQRRRLRAPARPAARPARRGHHLRHHLPQAQRDRGDRRLASRSSATARRSRRSTWPATTSPRTASSPAWSAATSSTASRRTSRTSARRCCGSRTGPCTARPSTAARGRRRRQPHGAARRDRRPRRADGRRPHRARDERLRPQSYGVGISGRVFKDGKEIRAADGAARRSTTASPTPPRTASATAST